MFIEPERVGVYRHCGTTLACVNVPEVVEASGARCQAAYAEHNLYTCSYAGSCIVSRIQEHGLNWAVVALPHLPHTSRCSRIHSARRGWNLHLFR